MFEFVRFIFFFACLVLQFEVFETKTPFFPKEKIVKPVLRNINVLWLEAKVGFSRLQKKKVRSKRSACLVFEFYRFEAKYFFWLFFLLTWCSSLTDIKRVVPEQQTLSLQATPNVNHQPPLTPNHQSPLPKIPSFQAPFTTSVTVQDKSLLILGACP